MIGPSQTELSVVGGGGRWRRWVRRAPRFLLPLIALLVFGIFAAVAGYLLGKGKPPEVPKNHFAVMVLNVGHGEASVARTTRGKFIVIGGGPPGQGQIVVEALRELGAEKIDLLILPYPYAEAIGGVPEVLSQFPVMQAVNAGGPLINQWQRQVMESLRADGIPMQVARPGKTLRLDGVKIEFLAPAEPLLTTPVAAADNSVVARLSWGDTRFLWAGGLETRGERGLIARMPDLRAQWLRAARFGTRNASSPEFLRLVSPEIAVVSVGANTGGYPHPEAIAHLLAAGARVYQTDRQSVPLRFHSDGVKIYGPND